MEVAMKITFVVPILNLSGGQRVVAIYAELLAKKGHTVTVVSPNKKKPTIKERIKLLLNWKGYSFKPGFDDTFFKDSSYVVKLLDTFRAVENSDVPDADIVIATFWNTAEWVNTFAESKGEKVYFIQHYELHPWLPVDRVKETLNFPFKKVCVSQWIANSLAGELGISDVEVVGNGVDEKQFFSAPRKKNEQFTVGVMYADELSFKGCDTSIASFLKAQSIIPSIKLVAFAKHLPVASLPLPQGTVFYLNPKQDEIRAIYSQCDAWLFGSRNEGFGLPILEAMACRTPVIGTKAGAAPELLQNGAGHLVNIDDVDAMAAAIVDMAEMTDEAWSVLSEQALTVAKKNSWLVKVDEFEQVLLRFNSEV